MSPCDPAVKWPLVQGQSLGLVSISRLSGLDKVSVSVLCGPDCNTRLCVRDVSEGGGGGERTLASSSRGFLKVNLNSGADSPADKHAGRTARCSAGPAAAESTLHSAVCLFTPPVPPPHQPTTFLQKAKNLTHVKQLPVSEEEKQKLSWLGSQYEELGTYICKNGCTLGI